MTWPDAFAFVGMMAVMFGSVVVIVGIMLTEKWPWN